MELKTIIVVFVIGFVAGLGTYKLFHNDTTTTVPVQETKKMMNTLILGTDMIWSYIMTLSIRQKNFKT